MIPRNAHTTRLYRLVALGFGLVACAVLGVVLVISFSRATVSITLAPSSVQTKFSVVIGPDTAADRALAGSYLTTSVTGEKTVESKTSGSVPAKAHGQIRILNTTSSPQPLAAGTRLLSADGVLFRTTRRLDVPANGSVEAEAEADQPGSQGEVGPGRFTLPGLRPANQEKIYGTSTEPMTGGTSTIATVSEADRAAAREALVTELIGQGLKELEATLGRTTAPIEVKLLSQQDTPLPSSDTALKLRITLEAVSVSSEALSNRIREELQKSAPAGHVVTDVNAHSISLALISTSGTAATVAVTATGPAGLEPTDPQLQADRFAGKTKNEIDAWAAATSGIGRVDVLLTPRWASRTPSNPQRIRVIISTQSLTEDASTGTVQTAPNANS